MYANRDVAKGAIPFRAAFLVHLPVRRGCHITAQPHSLFFLAEQKGDDQPRNLGLFHDIRHIRRTLLAIWRSSRTLVSTFGQSVVWPLRSSLTPFSPGAECLEGTNGP